MVQLRPVGLNVPRKPLTLVIVSAAKRPDRREEVLLGCNLTLSRPMRLSNQRHEIAV